MKIMLWVALAAVTGSALAQPPERVPDANEKIRLRLRLKPEQRYLLHLTTEQTALQALPGHAFDIQQVVGFTVAMRVVDVDKEGNLTIENSYRSIRMKVQSEPITYEYDSDHPPAKIDFEANQAQAMTATIFGALKDQALTITLSPNGHLREVKGLKEMWSRMQERIAALELPAEMNREQFLKLLEGMKTQIFDENAKTFSTGLAAFSETPVGIGDSWQSPPPADKEAALTTNTVYTLRSRRAGVATIAVGSRVKLNTPAAVPGLVLQNFDMSGTQLGTIEVDEATGWTRRGEMTLLLTGSMTMQIPGQEPPAITIPIHSRSTIHIASEEELPAANG